MLEHFRRCVEESREARIVYLGGSITEGQGVEDKRLCWQGLLQSELEKACPQCDFYARNAGIGGTDSRFGAFRMERDVLDFRPDLLFVEFAVNDYNRPAEEIRESLDAILFKLWKCFPECDVLFVLTGTRKMAEENRGGLPESVRIHMEVADRYGLPWVDVGERLFSIVSQRGINLESLLPDGVHPNRVGYRIYFENVWEFLSAVLVGKCQKQASEETARSKVRTREADGSGQLGAKERRKMRAEGVQENRYTACRMVPAAMAGLQGFYTEHIAMCGRYGSYVSSCRPGDLLEFVFRGDKVGLFYMISCDGGIMEWSLDSAAFQELSAWDAYARSFDRGSARMLAENLEPGEHRLCIRVASGRAEESKGNFIRISDFLI